MSSIAILTLLLGCVVAGSGMIALVAMAGRGHRHAPRKSPGTATLELECPVCQHMLTIHPNEWTRLSGPEQALVVSVQPEAYGRTLAEYRCPRCDTDHCFALDSRQPELIVSGAYAPRTKVSYCVECRRPLTRPPAAPESYDPMAPDAPDTVGLVCGRCKAVCCVRCVRAATRNRTPDGSMLCPRCYRGPVTEVHRF